AGTLSAGTLSAGTLSAGTLSAGTLSAVTLSGMLLLAIITQSESASAAEDAVKSEQQAKPSAQGDFVPLFNGTDIDDWIKRGGNATYHVKGNSIVGTSVLNTENTFLCTPRNYSDFVLRLQLKVDDGLNSGIQIRSEVNDELKEIEVRNSKDKLVQKKIPAGRVFGYQVEIDPSDRAYSGGIYDEARRGWLNDLSGDENKAAREAFKRGEWNKYRIRAVGGRIKTWVNGVPAADLEDDMTAAGFIALQVHGIGGKQELAGTQVRWRNLMIKEIKK
ncbi:MAG: 3-keto-disaccharide hydrolase, partial [Bythopirellula sp.]